MKIKGGSSVAIPQSYIYELCQRNEVTDVIAEHVQLKRRGRTSVGLCPFHNEKTPSFVVYPETQSFYCFGCGTGGDVITFIKNINRLDYVEAIKFLAARVGMPMPEEDDQTGKIKTRILQANKEAALFFVNNLNVEQGLGARAYLRRRGLSDATIRKFGLGFAVNSFDGLRNYLKSKGFSEEELVSAQLIKRNDKGNVYDVFRNRVMFPIIDLRGNVIAFGGRNMGEEKPKYLNSPETLVFKKSQGLFALNVAKKSKSNRYLIAEGYMDVIALHQAGFDTAVASLGTAFTAEQAKLISHYAEEVVLCYDADEAGQKAIDRALDIFSRTKVKVTVLKMEGAKDPDEFLQKYGAERFEMLLSGSGNSIEYALGKAKAKYNLAQADDRVEYLKEAINILAGPLTSTERAVYAGRIAEETDVPRTAVEQQLQSRLKAVERKAKKDREKQLTAEGAIQRVNIPLGVANGEKVRAVIYAEQQLIAAALKNEEHFILVQNKVSPKVFLSEEMKTVYTALESISEVGDAITATAVMHYLDENARNLLSRILADNHDKNFTEQDINLYIERMEKESRTEEAQDMSAEELTKYMKRLKGEKSKKEND